VTNPLLPLEYNIAEFSEPSDKEKRSLLYELFCSDDTEEEHKRHISYCFRCMDYKDLNAFSKAILSVDFTDINRVWKVYNNKALDFHNKIGK
jgi:hypothetical protein